MKTLKYINYLFIIQVVVFNVVFKKIPNYVFIEFNYSKLNTQLEWSYFRILNILNIQFKTN